VLFSVAADRRKAVPGPAAAQQGVELNLGVDRFSITMK
jgi:hypothetical protein